MSYRYDELTWPEINEAVAAGKIPVIAVGSVEQHGPHLPLKTDWFLAHRIVEEAAHRSEGLLLAMPPVHYGYITHSMDFPGNVSIHWRHLVDFCLDITKSLAYHGFKKMIIVNGHGSNAPLMELVGRRTNLETDAVCAVTNWWSLLTVDPEFNARWRESPYPGGCAHAGEMETSAMLHLSPETVKAENAKDHYSPQTSPFNWVDAFAHGPVSIVAWTSQGGTDGTFGRADLGTAEKGALIFEEAVKQLLAFAREFHQRPITPRKDHHDRPPTTPVPG